jgi:hypothetical protein
MTDIKLNSPKGYAFYPYLETPNKKFQPEFGKYEVRLRLTGADAQDFKAQIDKHHNAAIETAKEDNKGKKIKVNDPPYVEVVDDEGVETGELDVTYRCKAGGRKKDGEVWQRTIPIFDSKGKRISGKVNLSTGSIIQVSAEVRPYYVAATGAGITLSPQAVKLVELKTYSGASASSYGFDTEDDGYEFNSDDVVQETKQTADKAEDDEVDAPDFL